MDDTTVRAADTSGRGWADAPPDEDAGLRAPANRVDPRAKAMWALTALLEWLLPLLGIGVWAFLDDGHRLWQGMACAVVLLAATGHVAVMPQWRYRVHRWEVTDAAVYTQSGWITQERRIAPLSRVQTVDSERGPLERLFGLGTVTVTTASAAGPVRIEGLAFDTVRGLVARITAQSAADAEDAT